MSTAPVSCTAAPDSLLAITPKNLKGQATPLCQYQGKVLMVVNTASMCGYTPQLTPLQGLYNKYGPQGLVVLGFPSDSFNQEYSDGDKVSDFCTTEYHITFPLFDIANVIAPDQQPVFEWLNAQPGMSEPVAWNFEKFLIGKDGKIAKRFLTGVTPDAEEVTTAIESELAK